MKTVSFSHMSDILSLFFHPDTRISCSFSQNFSITFNCQFSWAVIRNAIVLADWCSHSSLFLSSPKPQNVRWNWNSISSLMPDASLRRQKNAVTQRINGTMAHWPQDVSMVWRAYVTLTRGTSRNTFPQGWSRNGEKGGTVKGKAYDLLLWWKRRQVAVSVVFRFWREGRHMTADCILLLLHLTAHFLFMQRIERDLSSLSLWPALFCLITLPDPVNLTLSFIPSHEQVRSWLWKKTVQFFQQQPAAASLRIYKNTPRFNIFAWLSHDIA